MSAELRAHVDSNYTLSDSQTNSLDSKSAFSTHLCMFGKFSKNYLSDTLNSTITHRIHQLKKNFYNVVKCNLENLASVLPIKF